jgi:hypothetical protein
MPTGLELDPVDPGNPAELPPTAKPGKKIIFLSSIDGLMYVRDDGGVDTPLGDAAAADFIHNVTVNNGDSPYNASYRETVAVNPSGVGGVEVVLPDPNLNPGRKVQVLNETAVENEDAPPFSDDMITVSTTAGSINGSPNDTLTTQYESRTYEARAGNWVII